MRKPRDYDTELRSLNDRARELKARKLMQLGELVSATAADTLAVEQLTGVLLAAVDTNDATIREGWRRRGAAFFRGRTQKDGGPTRRDVSSEPAGDGDAQPAARQPGAD